MNEATGLSRFRNASDADCQKILSVRFDFVSYQDVLMAILDWKSRHAHEYITLTPPHSVLMCGRDDALQQATRGAAMTLPDGIGIIIAANLLGYKHDGRVSGPTLMLTLCESGREFGLRHFFYGGAAGVADALSENLKRKYPGMHVVGTLCPPFRELSPAEDAEIVQQINDVRPDIIWVGLGSPKQEKWMAKHVGKFNASALIGVGAAFDFHSGRIKWAPAWVRKMGIEWAYRLTNEPKRMWRRNIDSLVFLVGILRQHFHSNIGHRWVKE